MDDASSRRRLLLRSLLAHVLHSYALLVARVTARQFKSFVLLECVAQVAVRGPSHRHPIPANADRASESKTKFNHELKRIAGTGVRRRAFGWTDRRLRARVGAKAVAGQSRHGRMLSRKTSRAPAESRTIGLPRTRSRARLRAARSSR